MPQQTVRLDTSLERMVSACAVAPAAMVLATIVHTAGSTYRKAGARMLIRADGTYLGLLSGGCLEADLREHADQVLRSGHARAVEYDMRGPDDILYGIGAGCEGAMRVLLEPIGAGTSGAQALQGAVEASARGDTASLMVVHESTEMPLGTYRVQSSLPTWLLAQGHAAERTRSTLSIDTTHEHGRTRALAQYVAPIPRLLICGCGPDAEPVARAALALGWRVVLVDHRAAYAKADRFPGATVQAAPAADLSGTLAQLDCHAVVVMSHHLASDTEYLRVLARHDAPGYIGLLGPAARRRRLLADLGADAERLSARLRAPVGLRIGAVTPEGIALSMIGEIHAYLAGLPTHGE